MDSVKKIVSFMPEKEWKPIVDSYLNSPKGGTRKSQKRARRAIAQKIFDHCCERQFCLTEPGTYILEHHPNIDYMPGLYNCLSKFSYFNPIDLEMGSFLMVERAIRVIGADKMRASGNFIDLVYAIIDNRDPTVREDFYNGLELTNDDVLRLIDRAISEEMFMHVVWLLSRDPELDFKKSTRIIEKHQKINMKNMALTHFILGFVLYLKRDQSCFLSKMFISYIMKESDENSENLKAVQQMIDAAKEISSDIGKYFPAFLV